MNSGSSTALDPIRFDSFFAADAAADFDGDIDGFTDVADDRGIGQFARKGAVQVDDVEKHGPFVAPFDGSVDGVLKIGRTVVLDALAQADSMAVLDIDSGKYDHSLTLSS